MELTPEIPAVLAGLIGAVVFVVTWLSSHTDLGKTIGPRNMGAAVAVAFAVGWIILEGIPELPYAPENPDVMAAIAYAVLVLDFVYGLILRGWKYAQIIYDALAGQLSLPEEAAL